jgi:molybdopterin/thiamine biosynthesis adenylyltransferase/rhodanese-related sulfurtransferase
VDPSRSPELSADELRRYARQLTLPDVGLEGQRRLKAAQVLVIGVGGLGSPAALYLAAAGVGTLGLVDADTVELSNLHRQVLHGTAAVGTSKLASAAQRLGDANPEVRLVLHETRLTSGNALDIIDGYDVVVDGSDNFPTRYLVNDACALLGKPDVYGAVHRFEGQAAVFWAARGPCYRCLYREPPPPGLVPNCAEAGVLGVLPGIVGTLQAAEAIKLVLGVGEPLIGRLLAFDALRVRFRELSVPKDPTCPLCGERPSITALVDYDAFCGAGSEGMLSGAAPLEIGVQELAKERQGGTAVFLLDVRERFEFEICRIAGSVLIPLGQLPSRLREVPADAEVVTICHTGLRSLAATRFLRDAGVSRARSLRGGVEAWALKVDPAMPRY